MQSQTPRAIDIVVSGPRLVSIWLPAQHVQTGSDSKSSMHYRSVILLSICNWEACVQFHSCNSLYQSLFSLSYSSNHIDLSLVLSKLHNLFFCALFFSFHSLFSINFQPLLSQTSTPPLGLFFLFPRFQFYWSVLHY